MKRSTIILTIVLVVVIVAAAGFWYWSSTANTSPAVTQTTNNAGANTNTGGVNTPAGSTAKPSPTSTSDIVLNSQSTTTLGIYLTAPNGMTLYIYKSDKARVSNCTGACAITWPPYTVSASVAATLVGSTPGITGSVGTIKRANGTIQVTYNNLPLYFYSGDKLVGDAKGQNVAGFVIVNL